MKIIDQKTLRIVLALNMVLLVVLVAVYWLFN
jgi:hypothetical protein